MPIDLRRQVAQYVREHPALWNMLQPNYRRAMDFGNKVRIYVNRDKNMVSDPTAGNDLIRQAIASGRPFAIGKVGSLEAEGLECFMAKNQQDATYPAILSNQLLVNVGIHPVDNASINAFMSAYLKCVDDLDITAAWGNPGETKILRHAGKARPLVRLRAFEPWYHADPWTRALEGKRVVVISPFAQSILSQYQRREKIWANVSLLPEFHLRGIKMPLSPGLVPTEHANWKERLAALTAQIDAEPYDVLLVGAGGLSLPLVSHAKAAGKAGFHLGGLTQILFGVMGRRWDNNDGVQQFVNDFWVRPAPEETPETVKKVENGAYW